MSQVVVESVDSQEGAVIAANVLRSSRLKSPCVDAPRPIDLVHLSKFTLGNRELEAELLGLFKSQSYIYLERMKLAETEEEWVRAAHSLKGSARAVGAWIVGEVAERAEQTICEAGPERHTLIGDVRREVDSTNRYIEDLFTE
ncbi:MAG: Hpt domain-containing protein [Parvibaculaceae bacterium]|nr:Hpt domain-containing protein [Parvibaculaceae bacterium]